MKYPEKKSEFRSEKLKEVALKVPDSGELLKFLVGRFPEKSRSAIKSILAHKQITVDDRIVTQFDHQIKRGQTVYLNKRKSEEKPRFRGIRIVYEDVDLIIVDKLAGLSTTSVEKDDVRTVLFMLDQYVKRFDLKNQVFAVNTIEREASGLVIFARNQKVQDSLRKEWKDGRIEISYTAVVEGELLNSESLGLLTQSEPNSKNVNKSVSDPARKNISASKVIKTSKQHSLLEIKSVSSPKIQIPELLKDLGFPVAGDQRNLSKSNPLGQLGFHCRVLAFKHPKTGKLMRFETVVPAKFQNLFRLRPYNKINPKTGRT